MSQRKSLTTRQRVEFFAAREGRCEECTMKCGPKGFEIDHRIALANGGTNDAANLRLLCKPCHRIKTKADVKAAAKGIRVMAQNIGAKRPRQPMPGSKRSRWKKHMDGRVTLR